MAKKSSRGRGPKRQVDWVVNPETYGATVAIPNGGFVLLCLVPSLHDRNFVDTTLAVTQPRYMWPEQDSGQVAYAVKGSFSITPSVWAVGTLYRLMARVVKKPMEYGNTFQAIVDPGYSLFQAEFANERFLWQRYVAQDFGLGSVGETVSVNWSGNQKLDPDEGLWLALENESGITISLIIRAFMRTLMRADG